MNPIERRATAALSAIYALRMVGLFMLLPVLSLHLDGLDGSPALIGIALGIYGFSQALLQIPFGMLSDRIGRKPVIAFGLMLFAAGSVLAASADSTMGIVVGRALQGSGAIASSIMALLADFTREEQRTKAMAAIGMTIGASYMASLVLGPVLAGWVGVSGLFWMTAVAALGMVVILRFWVPTAPTGHHHRDVQPVPAQFLEVLKNGQLLRLDFSIFMLHAVMTANFVALPLVLRDRTGLPVDQHWMLYLGVVIASLGLMIPLIVIAEKYRRMKPVFLLSIGLLAIAELALWAGPDSLPLVAGGLFLFFVGFNVLEASLPSLISKAAPLTSKGTALGVYSTAQFMGAFTGGVCGGLLLGWGGAESLFMVSTGAVIFWGLVSLTMSPPAHLLTKMVNVGKVDEQRARQLTAEFLRITGVAEAVLLAQEGIAYLKVDSRTLDADGLQLLANEVGNH